MFGKDDTNQQLTGLVDQPFSTPTTTVTDDLATALADESGNQPAPAFAQQVSATSLPQVQATEPAVVSTDVSMPTGFNMPDDGMAPEPMIAKPVATNTPVEDAAPINTNNLLDIKQQVLQQLSPIFDHLEQTPEERFRTTMMMIQATDNQALIKDAYNAALKISDDKIKAQALLDVVNEINYFTQQANQNSGTAA
jgi:hypothetical protein